MLSILNANGQCIHHGQHQAFCCSCFRTWDCTPTCATEHPPLDRHVCRFAVRQTVCNFSQWCKHAYLHRRPGPPSECCGSCRPSLQAILIDLWSAPRAVLHVVAPCIHMLLCFCRSVCLQAILNVFREDPEFAQHEAQYKAIARELLGDESEEGGEEGGE